MSFFPEGYEIPTENRYMRFEEGRNKFRILAGFDAENKKAIMGTEYWVTVEGRRKPRRLRINETVSIVELEIDDRTGDLEQPKHFWAMPVYNHQERKIQILEITQSTIKRGIKNIVSDEDWGNPRDYDLVVTKNKIGEKIEYSVNATPHKPLDEAILKEFEEMSLNLEALFEGKDPFAPEKIDIEQVDAEIEKQALETFTTAENN